MPHYSHNKESKIALIISGVLLAIFVITVNVDWPYVAWSAVSYASVHTFIEIIVIVIASLIFGIVWGIRHEKPSPSLILFACVFLCVAIIDTGHLLSFRDMPLFISPSSREKSIFFWQVAHLFGSLSLLVVALHPVRTYKPNFTFSRVLPVCLLITIAIFWFYFAYIDKRESIYLIGEHLSNLKLYIEYFLITINFIAAALFFKYMFQPRTFNTSALFAASFILGMGEYYYTIYSSPTDIDNLLGHIYKIIGFGFLYWAVFVETLQNPYKQLRESREQLRATMLAMPDLVFEMNSDYEFVANYSANKNGLYVDEPFFLGRHVYEVLPPDISKICIESLDEARDKGASRNNIICLPLENGDRWFEMSISIKPMPDEQAPHFVVISRDITDRLESENALRVMSHAFSQSPIGFFVTDVNHQIEFCNQTYADLCNSKIGDIIGRRPFDIPNVRIVKDKVSDIIRHIEHGEIWRGELSQIDEHENHLYFQAIIFPVRDGTGEITNFITHLENITEKKRTEAKIKQLSQFDQLTNLPNIGLLKKHFSYIQSLKQDIVVMWVDIDNFKDINDSLGHHVGDEVLRIIARRIHNSLDDDCMVTRLSGDDFVVIQPVKNQAEVVAKVNNIAKLFTQEIDIVRQSILITVSIGVVVYPDDSEDFDSLIKNAESAKYKAKSLGRNNICFFKQEMQSNATRLLGLSNALKQAHIRNELRMVYQPQFSLETQEIIGVEALIRWNSPEYGSICPEEFIRIAESNGFIIELGSWILQQTIAQIKSWHNAGIVNLNVSINLSPIQFNCPSLGQAIIDLLQEYDLRPNSLTFEITEATAMADPQDAAHKIHQLRALGINFAIDDFGTGYSSLSYLKKFKIQKIKIDKSFIHEIAHNEDDKAIVNAIIRMAHKLDIMTLAEGVETLEQLQILKEMECDEVQGFYFSKPLEANEFTKFARDRKK